MDYSESDIDRFWSKVDIKSEDECWEWQASLGNGRYGQFWKDKTYHIAHRVAWEICNGSIPESKLCLHTCDNTKCCNPKHLYLGSQFDNMRDKCIRGRRPDIPLGILVFSNTKLHDYEIEEIRSLVKSGKSKTRIAKSFGIGRRTLYEVIKPKHPCVEGYYV